MTEEGRDDESPCPVTERPERPKYTDGLPEREGPEMREWMDLQICKQRREEMMREAEQNRLGKALRDSRKRRGAGRAWAPAWELKRIAGSLLKLLRSSGVG
jgi:hypothetical protein